MRRRDEVTCFKPVMLLGRLVFLDCPTFFVPSCVNRSPPHVQKKGQNGIHARQSYYHAKPWQVLLPRPEIPHSGQGRLRTKDQPCVGMELFFIPLMTTWRRALIDSFRSGRIRQSGPRMSIATIGIGRAQCIYLGRSLCGMISRSVVFRATKGGLGDTSRSWTPSVCCKIG